MKYKSPYRVILNLKEKELNEKRKELAVLMGQKNEINKKIEKEKQKMMTSYERMMEGSMDPAYFSNGYDHAFVQEMLLKLHDKEQDVREKLQEYNIVKKKKEAIIEMDSRKKKEFEKMVRKKEQKKINSLHVITKLLKDGGE